MTEPERDRDPIEHGSRHLMSRAMYAKLKAVVDSWEREERANQKIAARAVGALILLAAASIAAYRFLPYFFDLVLWGGGEILKDYTNKLSLFYWAIKLWAVSLANPNLVGAFQGGLAFLVAGQPERGRGEANFIAGTAIPHFLR